MRERTTPADEAAVQRWRRESAGNDRVYRELAEVLNAASRLERPLDTTPPSPVKLIHAAASTPRQAARASGSVRRRSRRAKRWLGRGGAAAAVLLLGFAFARLQGPSGPPAAFEADEFVTGVTETATLTLRDGTVVRLAPQSRLRLISGTPARNVSLRGRAYFAVAKDHDRPFRIETGAGSVEVLGTRFGVEVEDDELSVVVVEGRVALSARGGRTEVPAGVLRRVVGGTTLPAMNVPDAIAELGWVGDFLAFQETPLRDAAREIAQVYGVRIEITDDNLARQTITTWFADQTLDQVVRIFCLVAEAHCTMDDGLITVERKRSR